MVDHCTEAGWPAEVRAAVLYTRPELTRGVERPKLPFAGRLAPFTPVEVVLTTLDPVRWGARGGAALAVLPLLGAEETVRSRARSWWDHLQGDGSIDPEQRRLAGELFLCFLADRLGTTMDVRQVIGGVVRDTLTGQNLLREGRLEEAQRFVRRLVQLRLGSEHLSELEPAIDGCKQIDVLEEIGDLLVDPTRDAADMRREISRRLQGSS